MTLEAVPVMKKDRVPRKKDTRAKALVPFDLMPINSPSGRDVEPPMGALAWTLERIRVVRFENQIPENIEPRAHPRADLGNAVRGIAIEAQLRIANFVAFDRANIA